MRLNGHSWRAGFDKAGLLLGAIGLGEDVYLREFGRAVGYLIWICQGLCHIWLLLVEIDAQLDITPWIDIYFCQWRSLVNCLLSRSVLVPRVAAVYARSMLVSVLVFGLIFGSAPSRCPVGQVWYCQ